MIFSAGMPQIKPCPLSECHSNSLLIPDPLLCFLPLPCASCPVYCSDFNSLPYHCSPTLGKAGTSCAPSSTLTLAPGATARKFAHETMQPSYLEPTSSPLHGQHHVAQEHLSPAYQGKSGLRLWQQMEGDTGHQDLERVPFLLLSRWGKPGLCHWQLSTGSGVVLGLGLRIS